MSHIIALLLVTESSDGTRVVFRWPPSPSATPRLARPRPSKDFETDLDNPWRAFYPSPAEAEEASGHSYAIDDDEFEWKPPYTTHDRSASFSTSASVPQSGRSSPSKDDLHDLSLSTLSLTSPGPLDGGDPTERRSEYKSLFGYPTTFLASLLCPKSTLCHQKFELVVDDLVFIGHPVCADNDRVWRFPSSAGNEGNTDPRGRRRSEANVDTSQPSTRSESLQTFHFVVVFDLPDPASSATGNVAKYFHVVYEQIAFTFTAVLFQEQVHSNFVEDECEALQDLREQSITRGTPFLEYVDEALQLSSIASAMKTLFEAIRSSSVAYITIHDLPLELQLPPYLDAILRSEEDMIDFAINLDEDAPNYWGPDMGFAWRLPPLAPWKSLLLLDDVTAPELTPDVSLRSSQVNQDDRPLAESLFRFLQNAQITVSLHNMAMGLAWDLKSQVYPTVRWLVQHRRAKVVDVVHERLKTRFTIPAKFPAPLAQLSAEFAHAFGDAVPPLPVLLASISASTHRQAEADFFSTIVRERALLPIYLPVVRWLLRKDLLVRLHLRIRIVATPELKARVRAERERARARKGLPGLALSTLLARGRRTAGPPGSKRASGSTGREAATSPGGESAAGDGVFVPFSPRSARMHARRVSSVGSAPGPRAPLSPIEPSGTEDEGEEDEDDWDEDTLAELGPEDDQRTLIKDPGRATPLERRWLGAMSEGKDPLMVARFDLISQYFDGKRTDDEILYRANISRKQLKEVLDAYEEFTNTFLHS